MSDDGTTWGTDADESEFSARATSESSAIGLDSAPENATAEQYLCEECNPPRAFKTEQGIQVHQGRIHKLSRRVDKKTERAAKPPKAPADVIEAAITSSAKAGKLTAQSTTLLSKLLGVGLSIVVMRSINATRNPTLDPQEIAELELSDKQTEIMFKPLFDAIGSSNIASDAINKVTGHKEYVLCGVFWYQYITTIQRIAASKEIKAPRPAVTKEHKSNESHAKTNDESVVNIHSYNPAGDSRQA